MPCFRGCQATNFLGFLRVGAPCIYRGDWGKFGDMREREREGGGSNATINRSVASTSTEYVLLALCQSVGPFQNCLVNKQGEKAEALCIYFCGCGL